MAHPFPTWEIPLHTYVEARPWFRMTRHDEPEFIEPAPESAPEPGPDMEPPKPAPPKQQEDLAAEVAKWKALARKHESRWNAAVGDMSAEDVANFKTKASEYDKYLDAQKTEAEKLAAAKDAAEARATAALTRAVAAEIKVLAADFADPTDAEAAVNASDFIDDKGDIDVEGIKARLNELLEAKPHWRKAPTEPPKPKVPKPDPGQGARGKPAELDYRSASKEDFTAALAEYRLTPRT